MDSVGPATTADACGPNNRRDGQWVFDSELPRSPRRALMQRGGIHMTVEFACVRSISARASLRILGGYAGCNSHWSRRANLTRLASSSDSCG